jgi:hypothetical protein
VGPEHLLIFTGGWGNGKRVYSLWWKIANVNINVSQVFCPKNLSEMKQICKQ